MRSFGLRRSSVALAAIVLALAAAARGHGVHLQRRLIHVRVTDTTIAVEYQAQVGKLLLILLGVGNKPLAELTDGDRDCIAQQVDGMAYPSLTVRLDDAILPLVTRSRSCRAVPGGVCVTVVYMAEIEAWPSRQTRLFVMDGNPHVDEGDLPQFRVSASGRIGEVRREKGGRAVSFRLDRTAAAGPDATSGAAEPYPSTRPVEGDRAMSAMTAFLEETELTFGTVLLALGVALVLGAVHALSPGHGKAMVAAYLVGSRGRIRDAVLLGGVVTFTHVISVLIIGVIALVLSKFIVPQRLFPWISAASGALIVVVGFWLLVRTAGGAGHAHSHHHADGHDHGHHHDEAHDHDHAEAVTHVHGDDGHTHPHAEAHPHSHTHAHVPEGQVTPGSMISLGIAGGMVPCPTALVVLLVAVTLRRIALGLMMILVFSVGLAGVLILIGVLTVTASRLIRRFSEESGWIRKLPIASSVVIMIIGLTIIFRALVAAGILSVHF